MLFRELQNIAGSHISISAPSCFTKGWTLNISVMNILEGSCPWMAREIITGPLPAKVRSLRLVSCLGMLVVSKGQLHCIAGCFGKSIPPLEGLLGLQEGFLLLQALKQQGWGWNSPIPASPAFRLCYFSIRRGTEVVSSAAFGNLLLACCHPGCGLVPVGAAMCHSCSWDSSLCHSSLPHTCKYPPGFYFCIF